MAGQKRAQAQDFFSEHPHKRAKTGTTIASVQDDFTTPTNPSKAHSRRSSAPAASDQAVPTDNPYGRREPPRHGTGDRSASPQRASSATSRAGQQDNGNSKGGSAASTPLTMRDSHFSRPPPLRMNTNVNGTNSGTEALVTPHSPTIENRRLLSRSNGSGRSTPLAHMAASRSAVPTVVMSPSHNSAVSAVTDSLQLPGELVATLNSLSDVLVNLASTLFQRNMAEKQLERRRAEIDQNAKILAGFHSLSEQKNNAKAQAEKVFRELDEELKKQMSARDSLVLTLVAGIAPSMGASNSVAASEDMKLQAELHCKDQELRSLASRFTSLSDSLESKVARLEEESYKIHTKLCDMEQHARVTDMNVADLKNSKTSVKNTGVEQDVTDLHKTLNDLDASLKNEVREFDIKIRNLEERIARRREETEYVESLAEGLAGDLRNLRAAKESDANEIRTLVADQNTRKLNLEEHASRIKDLEELSEKRNGEIVTKIAELESSKNKIYVKVENLNTTVEHLKPSSNSNENELRLKDLGAQIEHDLDKNIQAGQRLVDELQILYIAAEGLESRIMALETDTKLLRDGMDDIERDRTKTQEQFRVLQADIDELREEQMEKDKMIGEEITELRNKAASHCTYIEELRAALQSELEKLGDGVATLERQGPQSPLNDQGQIAIFTQAFNNLKRDFHTLESHVNTQKQRMDGMTGAMQSYELRMNNISSEDLARKMVNQMSVMYPHPANYQHEVERSRADGQELRAKLAKVEADNLQCLSTSSEALGKAQSAENKADDLAVKTTSFESASKSLADRQTKTESKLAQHKSTLGATLSDMNERLKGLSDDLKEQNMATDELKTRLMNLDDEARNLDGRTTTLERDFKVQQDGIGMVQGAVDVLSMAMGKDPIPWEGVGDSTQG